MAIFAINQTSTITKDVETQGMQITVNTVSKDTGEMQIDIATGLLSTKTTHSNFTGSAEVQGIAYQ